MKFLNNINKIDGMTQEDINNKFFSILNELNIDKQEWINIKKNQIFKLENSIKPLIDQHNNAIMFYNNSSDENNKNIAINFYNMACTDKYEIENYIYLIDQQINVLDQKIVENTKKCYLKNHKIMFKNCLIELSKSINKIYKSLKNIEINKNKINLHKKLMNDVKSFNKKLKKPKIIKKEKNYDIESIIIQLKTKLKPGIKSGSKKFKKIKYKKKKRRIKDIIKNKKNIMVELEKNEEKTDNLYIKDFEIKKNSANILKDTLNKNCIDKKRKKKKRRKRKNAITNNDENYIFKLAIEKSNREKACIKIINIIVKKHFNKFRYKKNIKNIQKAITFIESKGEKECCDSNTLISEKEKKQFIIDCNNKYTYIGAKICEYCDNFKIFTDFYNTKKKNELYKDLEKLSHQLEDLKNNLQNCKNVTNKFKNDSNIKLEIIESNLIKLIRTYDDEINYIKITKNQLSAFKKLYDHINNLYIQLDIENNDFNDIFDDLLLIIYNPFNKKYIKDKLVIKMKMNKKIFSTKFNVITKNTFETFETFENTNLYFAYFIEYSIKYILLTIDKIYNSLNLDEINEKIFNEEFEILEKNDSIDAYYEYYRSEINELITDLIK